MVLTIDDFPLTVPEALAGLVAPTPGVRGGLVYIY